MKALPKTLRTTGVITFTICLLLLVRKHDVGFLSAFFILSCSNIIAYLQGFTENIESKAKDGT